MGRQVLVSTVIYREWLTGPVVAAGDFNHNVRWDRPRGRQITVTRSRHSKRLAASRPTTNTVVASKGWNRTPTFYLYRNVNEPSHIDYVFVPRTWRILDVTVGGYDEWKQKQLSDHPVAVDVQPG